MAIQIKLSGNDGTSRSDAYKEDKVPATQGNVINTLNSYNEKLKKEYYDKAQARADENALQTSLEKVIKLLEANTAFKNKTKTPNTSSEDTSDNRLEAYDGTFIGDNGKSYDVAGLVQKLNIIANLVSGDSVQAHHKWDKDAHGNNVGKEESTGSVPIIGLTRGYTDIPYTANFSNEDNKHILEIGGLSEHSSDTVLSEKQVADMISQSVKEVLGNYDSQISVMLSYMLFAENGLPESYQYILQNTTAEKIQDAPMYVVYDEEKDCYYVRDLDGAGTFQETEDYIINKNNFQDAYAFGIKSSLAKDKKWTLKFDESLTNLKAYYNNEEAYTLPIPQKTLTINLGQLENETDYNLAYQYRLFNSGSYFEETAEVINGTATINVPVAAKVTVDLPNDFDGELFTKYSYTDHPENSQVNIGASTKKFSVSLVNDQTVYAKIIKYTLNLNNGNDSVTKVLRYKSDVVINITLPSVPTKTGYNLTGTTLGGNVIEKVVTTSISNIHEKEDYVNFTEGEIVDELIWKAKDFSLVPVKKVLWDGASHRIGTEEEVNVTVLQKIPYSVTKDGYTFNGIFLDEECTRPTNGILPELDSISNLYARYDIIKYNYSLIANGAELPGDVDEVGQVNWDNNMSTLPVLTKEGYTFDGWYTSPNFNGGVVTTYQKADTVYYAKWTENVYTVNFVLDGLLSTNEKANFHPYFKYKSIKVSTSNLPMTIGDPIADGFKFLNWCRWSDGSLSISQIDMGNFRHTVDGNIEYWNNINIYAKWAAQKVPVKEEIYYQIDGSTEYDLAKTITHDGTVGQEYVYKTNVTVVDGFEEVQPTTPYIVKDKDNVVKRYFNRKTYNITYTENKNTTETTSDSLDKTFTYPDNNVPLKTPNVISDNSYSFASWVDKNGSEVSSIPAYTHENVAYTARYNQEAPVEDIDFSVNVEEDKITITKLEHATAKTLKIITSNGGVKPISSSCEITYDEVYNDDSLTTAYGFVFFGEEKVGDLKIVNASNYVDVPLKFKANVPAVDVNYTSDANARTITKKPNTVELESRFSDATGYIDFNSLTLAVGQKVVLRTKETFSRFASKDTNVIDFGNKKAPIELSQEIGGIKNFEVTKKVSYNAKGEITIKKGVFEGTHGPLQYKTGTGNGWLDVNQAETGDTIVSIDRVGTVYFRYGEDAEYNVGSPIDIEMPIMQHTVTFNLENLKTMNNGYHFGDFTDDANSKKFFTITVNSGNQLCKCDNYIKSVTATEEGKKWSIDGYNKGSGERATTFLKKDGTPFNEASIVDSDITLDMDFVPFEKSDFAYTTDVLVDMSNKGIVDSGEIFPLSSNVASDFIKKITYGKDFEINIIKKFVFNNKRILDDAMISNALTYVLDADPGKTLTYKGLAIKEPGKDYIYVNDFVDNDGKYTFHFDNRDADVFDIRNFTEFTYKFASMFQLEEVNFGENNSIYCSFDYTGDSCKLSKLHAYGEDRQGENHFGDLIRYTIDAYNNEIHFYHKDDIRAVEKGYQIVNSDGEIDVSSMEPTPHVNVVFHSALIGDEFVPCYIANNVEFKLQTVTKFSDLIESVSQNGFTLKDGWNVQEQVQE